VDASELRNLGHDELKEKLTQLKKELRVFRFQAKTGKLEHQAKLKDTRRDIARILTIMNEKELSKKQGAAA
jgi:large subunit ribosomal protein L29